MPTGEVDGASEPEFGDSSLESRSQFAVADHGEVRVVSLFEHQQRHLQEQLVVLDRYEAPDDSDERGRRWYPQRGPERPTSFVSFGEPGEVEPEGNHRESVVAGNPAKFIKKRELRLS